MLHLQILSVTGFFFFYKIIAISWKREYEILMSISNNFGLVRIELYPPLGCFKFLLGD